MENADILEHINSGSGTTLLPMFQDETVETYQLMASDPVEIILISRSFCAAPH